MIIRNVILYIPKPNYHLRFDALQLQPIHQCYWLCHKILFLLSKILWYLSCFSCFCLVAWFNGRRTNLAYLPNSFCKFPLCFLLLTSYPAEFIYEKFLLMLCHAQVFPLYNVRNHSFTPYLSHLSKPSKSEKKRKWRWRNRSYRFSILYLQLITHHSFVTSFFLWPSYNIVLYQQHK